MTTLTTLPAARAFGAAPTDPTALPVPAPAAAPAPDGAWLVEQPRRAFLAQIMGLPVSVHVRGPAAHNPEAAHAVEAVFESLRADDEMFSTWKPGSPVSRIRRGELALEDADARVREVEALCQEASRRTGGSFTAWLPGPDGTLTFDPTGLVKGWAVQQAFDELVASLTLLGQHDAMICAGGDVVVACARTDTPDWVIGIEDPRDCTQILRTIPLRSGAVATSGTAARGQHIHDPATGAPAAGLLSATITGPNLTWADVYATAAFVRGEKAHDWTTTLSDHTAVLVRLDGTVHTTPHPATRPAAPTERGSDAGAANGLVP